MDAATGAPLDERHGELVRLDPRGAVRNDRRRSRVLGTDRPGGGRHG